MTPIFPVSKSFFRNVWNNECWDSKNEKSRFSNFKTTWKHLNINSHDKKQFEKNYTFVFWLCMALCSSTNCLAASAVTLVASVWLVTRFCIRLLINSWSSLLTLFSNSPLDSLRFSWCLFDNSLVWCVWPCEIILLDINYRLH